MIDMNKIARYAEYYLDNDKQKDAPLKEKDETQLDEAKSSERIFIIDPVREKDVAVWDLNNMKKAHAYIKKNPSYIIVIADPMKINDIIARLSENADDGDSGIQIAEAVTPTYYSVATTDTVSFEGVPGTNPKQAKQNVLKVLPKIQTLLKKEFGDGFEGFVMDTKLSQMDASEIIPKQL